MTNKHQAAFMKELDVLTRNEGYRTFEAYSAFIDLALHALVGVTLFGQAKEKNEAAYMERIGSFRHRDDSAAAAKRALSHLVEGLEAEPHDFLGNVHMECAANKHTGQFFTPWALCMLSAEMTIEENAAEIYNGRILTIQEPACGCGAMVLACAEVLKARGIDPARDAHFTMVDVDLRCVKAAYIQTTLMGISATIHNANTLQPDKHYGAWNTFTAVMHPKWHRLAAQRREEQPAPPSELPNSGGTAAPLPAAITSSKPRQLALEL